jgi:glucose/arabinose dehydrogenase
VDDRFVPEPDGVQVESWVEGLVAPWSLVFLGGGRALVSERPGRIRLIQDGDLVPRPWLQVEAAAVGEGGLMGLALHPDFPDQPFLYAMHTYREGMSLYNRVVRIRDRGEQGELDRVIIDRIPGGRYHDGGRIGFGPDGMLYVTAGETFERSLAQDLDSLGGKILRATPEGSVPEDNPFEGSLIYSYGHRNPQGIDWHPTTGRLYASEHGPSGEEGHQGHDEINIVLKGENYGWPEVIGAPGNPDFVDPIVVWKRATPPAGIQFCSGELFEMLEGDLMVATLRSEALIRINLEPETGGPAQARVAGIERWFASGPHSGTYGRLRDVVQGPDGALYVLTSNRDGRGSPRPGDDRILRITPLGP